MTLKILRRGSARCIGLLSAFITILLCLYYISMGQPTLNSKNLHISRLIEENTNAKQQGKKLSTTIFKKHENSQINQNREKNNYIDDNCYTLSVRDTNITSLDEFSKFDFQPEWMRTKEYWDKSFETRFEEQRKDSSRLPLKVIIVPHSHNDPGWLKTFTNYFQSDSRQILNLVITKMQDYKDMTFIWSEISFLQLWWDQAHPTKQRALKKLIQSGRFEITTGGWVMTDEANVHLYAMIDQLIEGHQWVKSNLNVSLKVGWSIDPFGHGSTVPYLLSSSGFQGTIIQRIHYAWKQWFAKHQMGDFIWMPAWQTENDYAKKYSLLTHNMPFDIYSIKHSCGPHPFICLNFDFRKIPGEYTEYSIKAQFINDDNVADKAQLLIEQYSRTASLFPHNVALIPIGDDFRYNKEKEIEQQYTNYKKLIDHINSNKDIYKTDISFGTPKDYFNEIKKRLKKFPTFKGDFFVYSDIFSEGRPAYWSGYFTTRPFYKILSTELEHNLRTSEILFTFAYNIARQKKLTKSIKIFEKNYEKMILARRNLGLFQHHDAITGTSRAAVMRDYGIRLFDSIQDVVKMQEYAIEVLIQNGTEINNFILSEIERDSFNHLPRKTPITFEDKKNISFIIFNALAQERLEIITIRSLYPNVTVIDNNGIEVPIQINPVWNITEIYDGMNNYQSNSRVKISEKLYEILFIAKLPPLSLLKYTIIQTNNNNYKERISTIYCNECSNGGNTVSGTTDGNDIGTGNNNNNNNNNNDGSVPINSNKNSDNKKTEYESEFIIKTKQPGDIQLENSKLRLLFDEKSGFLKTITKKLSPGKSIQCAIKFSAYKSAQFHSGAYLFKTDPEQQHEIEKNVLEQYIDDLRIIITSGPITSDVTVIYGQFLAHTLRIFNTHTYLDDLIYIENDIDFETPPKNRETELFMRFITEIENGNETDKPEFYSDQNGFTHQLRRKVPSIGVEGNYFPITSSAFIQDNKLRLTILTTHAQGAASLESGQLELMLDRRTLYDDYRGMGEGITDSRLTRHKFWMLLEDMPPPSFTSSSSSTKKFNNFKNNFNVPTLISNHISNSLRYPANIYYIELLDDKLKPNILNDLILSKKFPCDIHLINLRTLTEEQLPLFPTRSALLLLQRQGYNCNEFSYNNKRNDYDDDNLNYKKKFYSTICNQNKFKLNNKFYSQIFKNLQIETVKSTSLTGLKQYDDDDDNDVNGDNSNLYNLEPMELRTFNLTFTF